MRLYGDFQGAVFGGATVHHFQPIIACSQGRLRLLRAA
jgi:hypothetical protein